MIRTVSSVLSGVTPLGLFYYPISIYDFKDDKARPYFNKSVNITTSAYPPIAELHTVDVYQKVVAGVREAHKKTDFDLEIKDFDLQQLIDKRVALYPEL